MAIGAVIGVEPVQIHLRHRVDHEPRQVIPRQPFAQRWRHQKRLLTVTVDEVLGHGGLDGIRLDPLAIPTTVVHWNDAPVAWLEPATKLVLVR